MSDMPELTPEERAALDAIDMTEILGTPSERLRFAMDKAIQFMRERNMARASEKLAWLEHAKLLTEIEKLNAVIAAYADIEATRRVGTHPPERCLDTVRDYWTSIPLRCGN